MQTVKTVIGWGIAGVAGVGVALLAVVLLASGCGRPPSGFDRLVTGKAPAWREPAVSESYLIRGVFADFRADPAKAAREYGAGVNLIVPVDDITATPSGFMVTHTPEFGVIHTIHLPLSAGPRLEGKKGQSIRVRGKVVMAGAHGLTINVD